MELFFNQAIFLRLFSGITLFDLAQNIYPGTYFPWYLFTLVLIYSIFAYYSLSLILSLSLSLSLFLGMSAGAVNLWYNILSHVQILLLPLHPGVLEYRGSATEPRGEHLHLRSEK